MLDITAPLIKLIATPSRLDSRLLLFSLPALDPFTHPEMTSQMDRIAMYTMTVKTVRWKIWSRALYRDARAGETLTAEWQTRWFS
jgi:hypothetical protein